MGYPALVDDVPVSQDVLQRVLKVSNDPLLPQSMEKLNVC